MIIPTSGADKTLGVHLQRIYKTGAVAGAQSLRNADTVEITKFSALIERGTKSAMALPDTRADLVARSRARLQSGTVDEHYASTDIAGCMINSAVEGQVQG